MNVGGKFYTCIPDHVLPENDETARNQTDVERDLLANYKHDPHWLGKREGAQGGR